VLIRGEAATRCIGQGQNEPESIPGADRMAALRFNAGNLDEFHEKSLAVHGTRLLSPVNTHFRLR